MQKGLEITRQKQLGGKQNAKKTWIHIDFDSRSLGTGN